MMRPRKPSEGVLEKRIEEEEGRAAGRARSFIQLESGGWPVHAPCSMRRPLNSGSNDRDYSERFCSDLISGDVGLRR